MAKESDRDADVLGVVTRALRQSTPELRTQLVELVIGTMIDRADWGSIMFWEGELENAVTEYLRMLNRNERALCSHCFNNLGKGLQERLRRKAEVE